MPPISSSARTDPLYFARHGETDWNVEGRLQGQRDTPLNARGRAQAHRCGEILGELFARSGARAADFAYIASPLQRAAKTMRILRGVLGLPADGFATDERLQELSFGAWEGFTIPELRVDRAAAVAAREQDKWGFVPPEGESYAMLAERIGGWYRELKGPSVVVAHGGTLRALLALLKIVPQRRAPTVDVTQGTVYALAPGTMTHLR